MSKIQIITSVVDGILEDVTVKIGEKIITDFEHLAFDWDVYEGDERASYQGNLEDCTEEEAKEYYNDLTEPEPIHEDKADGFWKQPTVDSRKFTNYVKDIVSLNEHLKSLNLGIYVDDSIHDVTGTYYFRAIGVNKLKKGTSPASAQKSSISFAEISYFDDLTAYQWVDDCNDVAGKLQQDDCSNCEGTGIDPDILGIPTEDCSKCNGTGSRDGKTFSPNRAEYTGE